MQSTVIFPPNKTTSGVCFCWIHSKLTPLPVSSPHIPLSSWVAFSSAPCLLHMVGDHGGQILGVPSTVQLKLREMKSFAAVEASLSQTPSPTWLLSSVSHLWQLVFPLAFVGFTAAASLVSLAWALASYQKALRDSRDDKKPISYMAVVIQFCWHFFTIAARVITFALFASVFQLYFGIFIVLHWCIMTFWIVHCETEFCITKWEEIVFDMVVGIIYIFSWFNVKEGRTRCRLFIYYFVILLENTALSALWYLYKAPQIADAFAIPALCVVFSSFLTGVVFMLMYYAFFHPNGPRFGQSPSCACEDPSAAFALPPDVATSTLRSISNNRSVAGDRDQKFAERDGCVPVFQVRPTAPSTPSSRPPRIEESVIKIDLFRNRYPAWERHVLDRSLRKAILAFECSPSPPRLQYKDDALIQERLEYETTL